MAVEASVERRGAITAAHIRRHGDRRHVSQRLIVQRSYAADERVTVFVREPDVTKSHIGFATFQKFHGRARRIGQVNVGAMKQFIPYAKFLKRAYQVKRNPSKHLDTLPVAEQVR